jgi:hypothetical protein
MKFFGQLNNSQLCRPETMHHSLFSHALYFIAESDKSRAIATDSIAGEVPEKYYVALNSDFVKVRYLLVYSKHSQRDE